MITVISIGLDKFEDFEKTISSCVWDQITEIILVTGTKKLKEKLNLIYGSDSRMLITYLEPSGIYSAMNYGITKASQEHIIFMNAGDQFFGELLLHQLEPETIYLAAYVEKHKKLLPKKFTMKSINMPTSHQSIIYPKAYLIAKPYDTTYKYAADFENLLHALYLGVKFVYLKEALSKHEARGSAKYVWEVYREYKRIVAHANAFYKMKLFMKFFKVWLKNV